jgi:serine/threonine protein kinase
MATVNRAEMRGAAGFRKQVALKRLHPHIADDPTMVQLFVHEARLASNLVHPNVAQTFDLGNVDGTYFIAMEYIAGPTLTEILKQSAAAAGPVPIPIALSILGQLCDALDYAHNLCDERGEPLGIIHRDVSPSNIIVSSTGVVKLIDFGIAKAAGSEKTKTGLIKGKFAYMAPEYIDGQLDLRADLFGVGVIAHELLTGRRLFAAKNDFNTIMRLREMPIQPPSRWNPDIPRDLDDIVQTALQREPDRRWQSAAAMRTAITNVVRSHGAAITNQEVIEWVEWAFRQEPPKEDSGLVRVIASLGEPSRVAVVRDLGPPPPRASLAPPALRPLPQLPPPAAQDEPSVGSEVRTKLARPAPAAASSKPKPSSSSKPKLEPSSRPKPKPAPSSRPIAPASPPGAGRAWRLLIVLIVLAVLTRDQLVVAGRALHDLITG